MKFQSLPKYWNSCEFLEVRNENYSSGLYLHAQFLTPPSMSKAMGEVHQVASSPLFQHRVGQPEPSAQGADIPGGGQRGRRAGSKISPTTQPQAKSTAAKLQSSQGAGPPAMLGGNLTKGKPCTHTQRCRTQAYQSCRLCSAKYLQQAWTHKVV